MQSLNAASGIDYGRMDPRKKSSLAAALETSANLKHHGLRDVIETRGESAHVIEFPQFNMAVASVLESLGSKIRVADKMWNLTGKSYDAAIARDALGMIVNDLITVGAKPVEVLQFLAIGSSDYLNNEVRGKEFITGWRDACNEIGASWGGGETPTLRNIIAPDTAVIAGSAWGLITPLEKRISAKRIREGDRIILFASSGVHSNGITPIRDVADGLEEGFLTDIGGITLGEEVLKPTELYANLLLEINTAIQISFAANITGHGIAKVMRALQEFTYVIDTLFDPQGIFKYLQQKTGATARSMHTTFNMGQGFAIIVRPEDVEYVLRVAKIYGISAINAGYVEKGPRRVVVNPIGGEVFTPADVDIR